VQAIANTAPVCGQQATQLGGGQLDNRQPMTSIGLAKESHCGIPWRVGTPQEPAPIRGVLNEGPGGFAQRSGQVGHRRIHGDDQVHLADHRRHVPEVLEAAGQVHQVQLRTSQWLVP
jgi:hypothetical protein